MRAHAIAFALFIVSGAAQGHLDPGLGRLAVVAAQPTIPASPTGGAVLGSWLAEQSACADALVDTRCGERAALAAYVRREAEIARISAGWDQAAQQSLAALRGAERRYASAVAQHEIDRRGPDHADEALEAAEAQGEAFVSLLRRTAGDTGRSVAVDASPSATDATMHATYALVMAEPLGTGTVTRDDVRESQRAWLAYRDAFVALAAALDRPSAHVETELNALRTRDLEGLIAD